MSRMELRVVATSETEATELCQELEKALSASCDVESYRFNDSSGRGMSGTDIAISFVVSVVAGITSTQLEKMVKQALAKWREAKSPIEVQEPPVEATPLDE